MRGTKAKQLRRISRATYGPNHRRATILNPNSITGKGSAHFSPYRALCRLYRVDPKRALAGPPVRELLKIDGRIA